MKDFLAKNWINVIGLGMVFTAFIYFLNLATERYEVPIELKIAVSLILGSGCIIYGIKRFQKGGFLLAQIMSGLGTAIIFATIAFISFTEVTSWSNGTLIATMGIAVVTSSYIADRFNMSILALISTAGGLITPFFIQATESLDIPLFIYLLLINVAAIVISVRNNWIILRSMSFILSLFLYVLYYYLFNPESWGRPFLYATALFLVYTVGFITAAIKKAKSVEGMDLFLSIINGINFVFWCHFILGGFELSFVIPMAIVGVIFLGVSFFIYTNSKEVISLGTLSYFLMSIVSLAICGSEIGAEYTNGGINYLIITFMWLLLLALVYAVIRLIGESKMILGIMVGFVLVTSYWYSNAWSVEWIPIFGVKYIPFFNLGAIVWILLATFGFSLSKFLLKDTLHSEMAQSVGEKMIQSISAGAALISHLVIGGLLTVQIINLWEAYEITLLTQGLMVSLMWFVYALILFLWSNNTSQKLFKVLGMLVIAVSTLKVFIFDLQGESTVEKVIFLLLFGGILFILGRVNQKSASKAKSKEGPSEKTYTYSNPFQSEQSSNETTSKNYTAPWKRF